MDCLGFLKTPYLTKLPQYQWTSRVGASGIDSTEVKYLGLGTEEAFWMRDETSSGTSLWVICYKTCYVLWCLTLGHKYHQIKAETLNFCYQSFDLKSKCLQCAAKTNYPWCSNICKVPCCQRQEGHLHVQTEYKAQSRHSMIAYKNQSKDMNRWISFFKLISLKSHKVFSHMQQYLPPPVKTLCCVKLIKFHPNHLFKTLTGTWPQCINT